MHKSSCPCEGEYDRAELHRSQTTWVAHDAGSVSHQGEC